MDLGDDERCYGGSIAFQVPRAASEEAVVCIGQANKQHQNGGECDGRMGLGFVGRQHHLVPISGGVQDLRCVLNTTCLNLQAQSPP